MKNRFAHILIAFATLLAVPAYAESMAVDQTVYEDVAPGADRLVADQFTPEAPSRRPLASFGPFFMVAPDKAELIGSIGTDTPAQFRALLKAFPGLKQIDMVDCPGTDDDDANLELARMVHRAGIATFVPKGGSVRSGGVELFLAGAKRSAAPDAEFAVHSWMDEDGLEPADYAADDPANLAYIAFYREMGMSDANARAFYALTNSVANDDALYLHTPDIARYVRLD